MRLGKYTLLEKIAVGGMAEVFRATMAGAAGFERTVAIKRILPQLSQDEQFVRMFIDEANIAAQLTHPNIAQIFELGFADGTYFIALEYVNGRDLKAIYDEQLKLGKPTPVPIAVHIALGICDALHYAYTAELPGRGPLKLTHRDISPHNVLVSYEGETKVIDFGLAKAAGRLSETQPGMVKGKLAYMSPEQALGKVVDHPSDVYSTGILLFELLTGTRLFFGTGDIAILLAVQNAEIPEPRKLNPAISPVLERIVIRALSADIGKRFRSALELHTELQKYLRSAGLRIDREDVAAYMLRTFAAPSLATVGGPSREPDTSEDEETIDQLSSDEIALMTEPSRNDSVDETTNKVALPKFERTTLRMTDMDEPTDSIHSRPAVAAALALASAEPTTRPLDPEAMASIARRSSPPPAPAPGAKVDTATIDERSDLETTDLHEVPKSLLERLAKGDGVDDLDEDTLVNLIPPKR